MKIRILYNFDIIYREPAKACQRAFTALGHQVECVNLGTPPHASYRRSGEFDINFYVGCTSLLRKLAQHGFPEEGKNLLWMLDPLFPQSAIHYDKMQAFLAVAQGFDAIACMDSQIRHTVESLQPNCVVCEIPYAVDERRILDPLPEREKIIDIGFLGRSSFRRDQVFERLRAARLNALLLRSCWGG